MKEFHLKQFIYFDFSHEQNLVYHITNFYFLLHLRSPVYLSLRVWFARKQEFKKWGEMLPIITTCMKEALIFFNWGIIPIVTFLHPTYLIYSLSPWNTKANLYFLPHFLIRYDTLRVHRVYYRPILSILNFHQCIILFLPAPSTGC